MPSYQLTLSPNYIPNWGASEALRELFQNGIDRENETAGESKFQVTYNPLDRVLTLGNPDSMLHKKTLLLGETTKDGKTTIGKYGEGYKLALLCLLRIGCRITILNYNEIWKPRIVKSRVFDANLIQIDVEKNKSHDGWLRYVIENISPEQYSNFQDQCLLFSPNRKSQLTRFGYILCDEKFKGKVYCNTLFVCHIPELHYGYDIAPGHIELNRDRNKVDSFNLTWKTSEMWSEIKDSKEINELLVKNAIDVQYFHNHCMKWNPIYQEICNLQYDAFLKLHGVNAVVCKDDEEAKLIKAKYGHLVPVILPEKQYRFIHDSTVYSSLDMPTRDSFTPTSWINDWINAVKETENYSMIEYRLEELKQEAEKWRYK